MAKFTKKSPDGTSFFNQTFIATPAKLKELFPDSFEEQNTGEDKTNIDFTLETESGKVFTIYDWKYYRKLKNNENIEWHIGAKDAKTGQEALGEVLALLK